MAALPTEEFRSGRTFRRLLGFLRPYRRGTIASFMLAGGALIGTVLIPYLTGVAINAVRHGNRPALLELCGGILLAGLGRLWFSVMRRLVAGRVSLAVEVDLREALYAQLQRLELGFFDRAQTGQLMSRATVDLQSVRFFLGYGLPLVTQALVTILLAAVAMFVLQPALAAISLSPVPFVVLIAYRYGRRSRPAMQEAQQRIAELTADTEETVSGIRVIKAFAQEERQYVRFRGTVQRVFDQQLAATRIQAFYNPLITFLPNLGLGAILLFGGREVIHGQLSVGAFTAFYAYLLMLIAPMQQLGYLLGAGQRATASGARIFEILDRAPRITSPARPVELPPGPGAVTLRGVGLTFAGAPHPALSDIDLEVPGGQTVALVGAMGSGKSALVSLLPRLYEATTGSVMIDGHDVRTLDVHALRHEIAIVEDDPFLFSASVHDNIAYARPGATREEVRRAAQAAQAAGFIERLPEGYETRIGERGLTLSGGQRQRLAIARAILARPRILVLDDATSSVDASTEQQIKDALGEVMAGRTTFVIAHRLSTIALAERIVVLEDGQVTADGSHEELLEVSELYREIVAGGPVELPDDELEVSR
jgi:ABC-type multidrug transport system fused ATPase/permease subunit